MSGIRKTRIEGDKTEKKFVLPHPTSGSELHDAEAVIPSAIIPGCCWRGHTTLFAGQSKSGKSTMIRDWLRRIHQQFQSYDPVPSMLPDRLVKAVNTLVISEESGWAWEEFVQDLPGTAEDKNWIRVLHRGHGRISPASSDELEQWCDAVIEMCKVFEIGWVIIDPVTRFGSISSENDNSEVLRAMMAFERIATESYASVLLLHHTSKNGNDPRGCGAWQQQPDAILGLRMLGDKENIDIEDGPPPERVRILTGKGRFPDIESQILCYADDEGRYHHIPGVLGRYTTKADLDGEKIVRFMTSNSLCQDGSKIRSSLGMEAGPFGRAMRLLVAKNRVVKSGSTKDSTYQLRENI